MEYKEINTRSGKHIVFCDFKELLTEFYKVSSFEEIEDRANSAGEFIIHCPFCKKEGHRKHKLYIKSDLTVGHCFVCCRDFINVNDEINLKFNLSGLLNFNGFNNNREFKVVPINDPDWSIESFKFDMDDYDEDGIKYLKGRHAYLGELYKLLDFKFLDGNVVVPFKHNGEVFYYQIRFSNPGNKIKYFMPRIDQGCKPPYIIERENEDARHRILIVEGIFDAIAALIQCPEYTPVAVLGSSITPYQMEFIRNYSGYVKEVRIWMDETHISKGIAKRLKTQIDYCPIEIIKSYGPDPEEILKDRMAKGLPVQWIWSKYK